MSCSEQSFLTHLQQHFDARNASDAIHPFRKKGWEKFCALGTPSKSDEAFRYVPLREFYLSSFGSPVTKTLSKVDISEHILPESKHSHMVFVDGVFSSELTDMTALVEHIVLLPLEDAFRTHGSFLQGHLTRTLKEEKDPFAFVNLSLHQKGAFLYILPKAQIQVPVQCLHIVTEGNPALIAPRLHLILGSGSNARFVATHHTIQKDASHFHVPLLEVSLEEGAHLEMLHVIDTLPAWHMETLRASLKKDAKLHSLSMTLGGKAVRQSYRVFLKGENSEANLSGLCLLSQNRTSHTHAIVEHHAPHTRSMQLFKCALNDHSQSSFEGKILVQPEAQKTQAYQLNNNLILNQGAVASSKPNLEIFADDVKASHGSTMAQLDEEQLFYLNTRGIDPKTARSLLIGGFCREMIDKIPYDSLLKKMHKYVDAFVK